MDSYIYYALFTGTGVALSKRTKDAPACESFKTFMILSFVNLVHTTLVLKKCKSAKVGIYSKYIFAHMLHFT